ncbi:hypothetical protein FSP39_020433 [Pinctada imbricata]|uniref:TIR domain-containing protein n=1 Tax=Pinctada imbricata TaxID=66713 RepID=A0AA88YE04_PINIB|nr:hypothetical protein FSP39_020433 [Pinctada imbricata]
MDLNQERKIDSLPLRQYHFDIYFIYETNQHTSTWVRNTCKALERDNIVGGYHERDFIPGSPVTENIKNCFKLSKHFGVLLTPGFNESQFCKYEMRMALGLKLESTESAERRIIPLCLSTDVDVPDELQQFTELDVSGPQERWWNRLVSAIKEPKLDDSRKAIDVINEYLKVLTDMNMATVMKSLSILDKAPLASVQRQIGLPSIQNMLLHSVGINCTGKSVQIDFAKLFPNDVENTKLRELCSVFNEVCFDNDFQARLTVAEEASESLTSECDLKFHGIRGFDHVKLSLSFRSKQKILITHNTGQVVSISHQNTSSALMFLAQLQCSVQLRSKMSKRIRLRFPPYRIKSHSTRRSKHYRNYRKILFKFPDNRVRGRYTYHRDSFREDQGQRHIRTDNEKFLLVQKDDSQAFYSRSKRLEQSTDY